MKLAVTGKGGVGKTTIAVFLARYLAHSGSPVTLIDADPDANAAISLGLDPSETPQPVSELKELIAERTGASGTGGEFFSLNPR
ncbi:MAG: AAA family ATPase, partial [Candidatus Brocadiia bacterium]